MGITHHSSLLINDIALTNISTASTQYLEYLLDALKIKNNRGVGIGVVQQEHHSPRYATELTALHLQITFRHGALRVAHAEQK